PEKEMAGYPAVERWEWLKMYGILKNMLSKRKESAQETEERHYKKEFRHNNRGFHNKKEEQPKRSDGFSNRPFANINKNFNK
ncbi:MAG: hypothetical protein N3B13_12290, partial [Deltaproteobacteria bacterium]|nr:hypothetical protein [Deltaproteobacteria bacterium]